MRNILATLILVIMVAALAVYDLVRGLYFYLTTGISILVISSASKLRKR